MPAHDELIAGTTGSGKASVAWAAIPPDRISHKGLLIHEPIIDQEGVWHGRVACRLHTEAFPWWVWMLLVVLAFAATIGVSGV